MRNRVIVISILVGPIVCLLFCCEGACAGPGDPNEIARDPFPADGQTNVAVEPNLILVWKPGDVFDGFFTQASYRVHLDVNEANVADADPYGGDGEYTVETSYVFTGLEPETEYFWRIDTTLV
ncbi:MAG: hypothetical protein ACYS8Z_20855, partial [Planctomycetota bacterium]